MLIGLLRKMPVWRRLELQGYLHAAARGLRLCALQEHYPHQTMAQLKCRLAGEMLGEELATKVYGPLPEKTRQLDGRIDICSA